LRGKGGANYKVWEPYAVSCAKTAKPKETPFGMWIRVGPRKHVLDGSEHWRHLANTTEPSLCGGYATFLSNYFDHLLLRNAYVSLRSDRSLGVPVTNACLCWLWRVGDGYLATVHCT